MTVYKVSHKDESPVAAHRLFKALVIERHYVLVKAQPHVFSTGEIIEGDGGVGTVTKITFVKGHRYKYMFHRFDELDTENLYCKYTLFEGDVLCDNIEKVEYEVKVESVGEGSKGTVTIHYHAKPGCNVNEEEIKIAQEQAQILYKQVEEYLIRHPAIFA